VRNVLRYTLKNATHCFADGLQLAKDVRVISGRKCQFLPSSRHLPVSGEKDLATQPPYNLAFLGRWHPNKGVDLLIEALQLLHDEDWLRIREVRIFGGGPLEDVVTEGVRLLRIKKRPVIIGGYLNRQEAADLLVWADYLLLPSRMESIPVIFSDALQANCPIIAMPVGDLPRLMTSKPVGVLANRLSATSFSTAVHMALETSPFDFTVDLNNMLSNFNVTKTANHIIKLI